MEWIKLSEKEPKKYEEVIICSDTGIVKSATYLGNLKWTTYNQVILWMHMPDAPNDFEDKEEEPIVEQPKKKRGRPKKV
jgi:hypothetical protein